jgi:Fe-S cluster assembly ATP-binding protein
LEVKNLSVSTAEGKPLLFGVSLRFEMGKRYALLGPNGSGKSTLVGALMGHPNYTVASGQILLDGKDITTAPADEKARAGLFLGAQYPAEIEGVSWSSFLRMVLAQHADKPNFFDALEAAESNARDLGFKGFDPARDLNVGFSGGEKKKSEILQLLALRPKFAFLDEPDSGLDTDGVLALGQKLDALDFPTALVLITHHYKTLETIRPDVVYILKSGKLAASGGSEILAQVQRGGFKDF